jgi:hypothetical protein
MNKKYTITVKEGRKLCRDLKMEETASGSLCVMSPNGTKEYIKWGRKKCHIMAILCVLSEKVMKLLSGEN